jgi:hypothetical protein
MEQSTDASIYKPNGFPWSFQEDEQLNTLYNVDMLDINEISRTLNRMPGSIITRLCQNKHIPFRTLARGYTTYKNSELYKSIVASGEGKRNQNNRQTQNTKQKITKTNDNISININGINNCDYNELHNDIKTIKNEINDLKSTLKDLVEMMKAVYEFEDA